MTVFEQAMAFVLEREGGATITDDANDPGGLTRYGISQRAHPNVDIRNLSEAEAISIYRESYWKRCHCDELPPALAMVVFDAAVNQGTDAAIRSLQKALTVKVDGIIGHVTLMAAFERPIKQSLVEIVAERFVRYGSNKNFQIYGRGWSRRLAACHQLALELA